MSGRMGYDGPGIYRHYKGGYYRAWGLARHESTGAVLVIYSSYDLDHERGRWMAGLDFVARPLNPADGQDAWNERPNESENGDPQERFVKEDGDAFTPKQV